VSFELERALLLSGVVSPEKLAEALHAVVTQGIPLVRAMVGLGVIDETRLETELARAFPDAMTRVVPAAELMERLPTGLCHRLGAAPVSLDPATGTVEVAVLDPRDPHPAEEVGYHLKRPVRARRASYAALREALEGYPAGLRALAAPMGQTPVWGTPRQDIPRGVWAEPSPERASPFPEGAILLRRKTSSVTDVEEVRFATRTWDSVDSSQPASREEASWDAEPVFELRRLGPPPTVPDPEPVTIRITGDEAAQFKRKSSFPPPNLPPPGVPPARLPLPPAIPGPSAVMGDGGYSTSASRVPIAPNAPALPYGDLGSTLSSIRTAVDRDAVLGLVQLGARTVARRVAMLVVRKDSLDGWSCTPEFGDQAALRDLKIPLRAPNLLTAVLAGGVHLGPLMGTVAAPLLRVMRTASQDVAIAALRVGDRPAVLIVADELGDTLLATKRLDELARAAGDALLRILRTKRE
jgi:hypothetical protein